MNFNCKKVKDIFKYNKIAINNIEKKIKILKIIINQ